MGWLKKKKRKKKKRKKKTKQNLGARRYKNKCKYCKDNKQLCEANNNNYITHVITYIHPNIHVYIYIYIYNSSNNNNRLYSSQQEIQAVVRSYTFTHNEELTAYIYRNNAESWNAQKSAGILRLLLPSSDSTDNDFKHLLAHLNVHPHFWFLYFVIGY